MQGLRAVHDHIGIYALHEVGRRIKQRPRVPGTEVLVGRLTPFLQHRRDLTRRDRLTIHRLDHEIVSLRVGDTTIRVAGDTLINLEESFPETTDGSRGQVPHLDARIEALPKRRCGIVEAGRGRRLKLPVGPFLALVRPNPASDPVS